MGMNMTRTKTKSRRVRVRLEEPFDYWMVCSTEVVFTAPKGYKPLNPSCIQIDESKFNFIKQNGGRSLKLICGPSSEPGSWWLA